MKILLVKMSSLGDVIHTLPAVSDLIAAGHQVDWVVEEAFVPIARAHANVAAVIPIAWRRWRKQLWRQRGELRSFRQRLRSQRYDLILDLQGLYKSAVVCALARGHEVVGFDRASARESGASYFYGRGVPVDKALHAVERSRRLTAAAIGCDFQGPPDFGLRRSPKLRPGDLPASVVFLHGTTWASKHWPERYWMDLAVTAAAANVRVFLPWGDATERERAERIAAASQAEVWPQLSLAEVMQRISEMDLVIGVDSGLTHLAAALGVSTVGLYGSTEAALTGAEGPAALNLQADFSCSPCRRRECTYAGPAVVAPACYARLGPDRVWSAALQQYARAHRVLSV